jgi:hypothetical protein
MSRLHSICSASLLGLFSGLAVAQVPEYGFSEGYGQIEVGGPSAGAEFHGSRPLPTSIALFYPVANIIDVSTDYWHRGEESFPMVLGLKLGDGPPLRLGMEGWSNTRTPHRVVFTRERTGVRYRLSYEFCLGEPAMVFSFSLVNEGNVTLPIEVYTHLLLSLRTSHTFVRRDSAVSRADPEGRSVSAFFPYGDTDSASVFVRNVGEMPSWWTDDARSLGVSDSGASLWFGGQPPPLVRPTVTDGEPRPSVAAFVYRKSLDPGDSILVRQVIGSSRHEELESVMERLERGWEYEVAAYDSVLREKASVGAAFMTGDARVDSSARWACALLAANAHHLDGEVVPMPCPVEYHFFFTHDLLLTDLGAVMFDAERVRNDLRYLKKISGDSLLAHAYYWKDGRYVTEWCTPDNWNHLWFIILSAAYLRHTLDTATVGGLYPMVRVSLESILTQRKRDDLMHGRRPDWWDIGEWEGPRAYLTILTIRAIKDYLYMSAMLRMGGEDHLLLDATAAQMQSALTRNLWDKEAGYLFNYNGLQPDRHYYMGSLLGAVYGTLGIDREKVLVETAERVLLDPQIGLRNVYPADFHQDSVRALFKFKGNEAGDSLFYANGGVWPHANAWFLMAMHRVGRVDDAWPLFGRIMTVDGISGSPMGLPAMYEYRYADRSSPRYGMIDKPSFLWAGGFYLQTLFTLLGVEEASWNIVIGGDRFSKMDSCRFPLYYGGRKKVRLLGSGPGLELFTAGGRPVPSRVLPLEIARGVKGEAWELEFGTVDAPYLEELSAILLSARLDESRLVLRVRSFDGHLTRAAVRAPEPARSVLIDGKPIGTFTRFDRKSFSHLTVVGFRGSGNDQVLEFLY